MNLLRIEALGIAPFAVMALSCAWAGPACAAVVTASFSGTVSTVSGGDARVLAGDAFVGTLALDTAYDYNFRIDADRARFIWWASDPYLGAPPLPVSLGFASLRTGEQFKVPVPGAAYDYGVVIGASSTIDFARGSFGQRLELGSFLQTIPAGPASATWTVGLLALAGAQDALFDGLALDLITARPGSVIAALSSARYVANGLDFTLALNTFEFGQPGAVAVPEPGALSLVALGLLGVLGSLARRDRRRQAQGPAQPPPSAR